ncbi:hypothetical protein DdX_20641 [Ditylenchus destructor]|uniref:Uncharacterized protein n=1 Tax=Ditylenchus destructor TaxID=166010 RepID=A0AAD4QRR2_9BILA|nr:hypothetical protein DdX_20641 [Ditylenchus destructor]
MLFLRFGIESNELDQKVAATISLIVSLVICFGLLYRFNDFGKRTHTYLLPLILAITILMALLGYLIRVEKLQYPFLIINALWTVLVSLLFGLYIQAKVIDKDLNERDLRDKEARHLFYYIIAGSWSELVVYKALSYIGSNKYTIFKRSTNTIPA